MQRTIIDALQQLVLTLVAREPMADGGLWLMSPGGGCALVPVGVRGGWKMEADDGG